MPQFLCGRSICLIGREQIQSQENLSHCTHETYAMYQRDSKHYWISEIGWSGEIKERIMWIGREEGIEHFG